MRFLSSSPGGFAAARARLPELGVSAALAPMLLPVVLPAAEHFRFDGSYQVYDETAGRMFIESYYYRGEMTLSDEANLRFQFLRDAISGSSPTGALPGSTQPFLAEIEDVRQGVLLALSHQWGDHRLEVEASHSKEQDYLSQGLSISDRWELNQKNTALSFGFNFLNDTITVIGTDDQNKKSYDLFFGLTQLLDKNTILTANLTLGYAEGYLNDQYKSIQRTSTLTVPDGQGGFITLPVTTLHRENRPSSRLRGVLQLQGTHYFPQAHAALDAVVRLGGDDYGVWSQSLQVEWRQSVMERLEVIPFFRYYQQSAADFFYNTLNETGVTKPADFPSGAGPNYSADYRLSSMATMSLGLKLRYRFTDNFSVSAAYEHYDMTGRGARQAPAESYPTAAMWTFGMSLQF